VIYAAGSVYGTTGSGGELGGGTLFELTPPASGKGPWIYSLLHSFAGSGDGARPIGALTIDKDGAIYGTTEAGGAANMGTVFTLTPSPTSGGAPSYALLYSLSSGAQFPNSGVTPGANGALYGTSNSPLGGAVFQLTPPGGAGGSWTEAVLHVFQGGKDGEQTTGGLLVLDSKGAVYGTTSYGGGHCQRNGRGQGCGVVYQVVPPAAEGAWTENILYSFSTDYGSAGAQPMNVVFLNGSLYGAANYTYGDADGDLFKLTPPLSGGTWQESTLYAFQNFEAYPYFLMVDGGHLYGTTAGGYAQDGTVFEVE
jgi:uncharacterized repeat protein (TIGR03803 family)